jgi:hypothetical protein
MLRAPMVAPSHTLRSSHTVRFSAALAAIVAAAACTGLIVQLVLSLARAETDPIHTVVRYLSFFTIVSNLMVALTCAAPLAAPASRAGRFFAGPGVRSAVLLYIAVTGIVWLVLLAPHYDPQGLAWWSNALLHYVVPVLYAVAWLAGAHGSLAWSDSLRWLVVPAAYLVWTLARGAWASEYPYGFVDVDELGMAAVLRNAAGLTAVFLLLGLVVVAIDRGLGRAGRVATRSRTS